MEKGEIEMLVSGKTDIGRRREINQDNIFISTEAVGNLPNLFIVADGMGGHRAGEVASSMVVTNIGKRFSEMSSVGSKLDAINWMNDNISEINKSIIGKIFFIHQPLTLLKIF